MDSKTVFNLRNEAKYLSGIAKLDKLNNALTIAEQLYSRESNDGWIQKALAYTLIDLSKYFISENNINQSVIYFNKLNSIEFNSEDEIIENQKHLLRPKLDSLYSEVHKAEELSKNGKQQEAFLIFQNLISQNKLTELHHESYGWIIYRYIKSEESNLTSIEVRSLLRDYMNLKNERPSMLHSMILNFALNYSKTHNDFKFYNFFILWHPNNLRYDDLHEGYKEDKAIPSLISRICKEFVNTNTVFDIEDVLINEDKLDKDKVLDFFREPFFWKLFHAQKENKHMELWNLFEQYNINYSKYGQSQWHSEILSLAERFMKENDEWRFLNFFINWNPENLRNEDWREVVKDENTYKPLAIKSIKKAFDALKHQTSEQNLSWLIQPYEKAIKLFPNDEWLLREKALLNIRNNEFEIATNIYKQLVLELSDKHYVWQEFSNCFVSNNHLKIGMLSKALSLENNEDYLGEIHLELAKTLIDENLLENAVIELELYKKHREIKGWKLSPLYEELRQKLNSHKTGLKSNNELYKNYIPLAENFAYEDFNWIEVVLVDKWKDEKGKERLAFSNGTIDFSIGKNRFEILKQTELGQVLKFKLNKQEIINESKNDYSWRYRNKVKEYKYIPLIAEKTEKSLWSILDDTYAVVDYINQDKNIVHAITYENKEVFFPQITNALNIGDFLVAKYYFKKIKEEIRTELRQIKKIDKETVLSKFQTQIAIVDGVNEQKQLFHFVISSKLQGIVRYAETILRPIEGDFIKLYFATKTDKDKKLRVKILNVELTEEENQNLRKDISGILEVKFKKNGYFDDDEDYFYEEMPGTTFKEDDNPIINNIPIPDFAFIGDYYVPKYLLEKHNITSDCNVNARAIFAGDKWKVTELQKI